MQVGQKEVESNTDVVPLTLDSNDVEPNVITVQIEHAKAVKSWIQTPTNIFARLMICGLQFVSYYPSLIVAQFMMYACFYVYKYQTNHHTA